MSEKILVKRIPFYRAYHNETAIEKILKSFFQEKNLSLEEVKITHMVAPDDNREIYTIFYKDKVNEDKEHSAYKK